MRVDIRDLTCFGRPARLVWIKRRWRCTDGDCDARTWTEHSEPVDAQAVLTCRAGAEACRQVAAGFAAGQPGGERRTRWACLLAHIPERPVAIGMLSPFDLLGRRLQAALLRSEMTGARPRPTGDAHRLTN